MSNNRVIRLIRAYLALADKHHTDYTEQLAAVLALHMAWYAINVSDVDAQLDARKAELLGFVNLEGHMTAALGDLFPT